MQIKYIDHYYLCVSFQHACGHSTRLIQQAEEELYDVLNKAIEKNPLKKEAIEKHFSAQATEKRSFDPM